VFLNSVASVTCQLMGAHCRGYFRARIKALFKIDRICRRIILASFPVAQYEMSEPITGGCLCGEIRYECRGDPLRSFICHCTDCQRFSGSLFSAEVVFPKESLRIITGTPKGDSIIAESGHRVERQFCGRCGSSLFAFLDKRPTSVSVQAGTLDDKSIFKPTSQVWTQSQVKAVRINDDLAKFERSSGSS